MWYKFIRALLFKLDPEFTHHLVKRVLRLTYCPGLAKSRIMRDPQYPVSIFNQRIRNPIGLSAGFDNDADFLDPLLALGFGFVEMGGVTPKAQRGNPKPRLFRLPKHNAIINRMGFPNQGIHHLAARLSQRQLPGMVGVNLGINRDTPLEEAARDYCASLEVVYPQADYVTFNISSPNTLGLRQLQNKKYLPALLSALAAKRRELALQWARNVPLLLKISVDLTNEEISEIIEQLLAFQFDGIVACNTSTKREGVQNERWMNERGGLSGQPIFKRSTEIVAHIHRITNGKLPIIAVGGICHADDAMAKFDAGASMVQLYTGFVYQGPKLIREIINALTLKKN